MFESQKWIDHNNDSIEKQKNITEAQKELETLKATNEITWKTAKALYEWLKDVDKTDNDAKLTLEMLELYKNRYIESGNKLKNLKWDIKTDNNEKNELSEEKLKTITNSEFLRLKTEERLQYVTKNNIDYSDISSWKIDEVTFFFDQDWNWIDDSDLYRLTTLWQVCGDEVWEVISNWITYTRSGLDWEFFNWNQRLIIETGTKVEFQNLRSTEEINKIKNQNSIESEKYPEDVRDIALESLERNINPELSILILEDSLDWLNDELRQVKIEEFLTQFDRLRPSIAMWNWEQLEWWKYPDELVIRLLKQFDNSNWKEKAWEYWIDEEHINYVDKKIIATFESLDLRWDLKEKTVSLIKHFEWFSDTSYFDYKQYTWGYGTKAEWPWMSISQSQAEAELISKLENEYLPAVDRLKDINPSLWDNQVAALTSFAFNLWTWTLKNFESLIKWYPNTAEQIASKMNLYVKAWWKTLSSLVDRRSTESQLFLTKNV